MITGLVGVCTSHCTTMALWRPLLVEIYFSWSVMLLQLLNTTFNNIRSSKEALPIINFVESQRIKRFGHLVKMDLTLPIARAYNMKMEASRCRGRWRKRFTEGLMNILRLHFTTVCQGAQCVRSWTKATMLQGASSIRQRKEKNERRLLSEEK